MAFDFFARFHVRPGCESLATEALRAVLDPSRAEPDCLAINTFRSASDPRLFLIHSRWTDEAAFDHHACLPHTANFVSRMEPLLDQPAEFTRTEPLG
jgi:quinol monooxygenase YgiN